jgi:UDP-N-acetylglucosamine 2-epimerase
MALLAGGVPDDRIWVTGNTGIDALRLMTARLDRYPADPALASLLAKEGRLIAVTVHRRENQPYMGAIAAAFSEVLRRHEDVRIVFPVHLSPKVREAFLPALRDRERCYLIEPLDYANFVRLLTRSTFVLTDSGGIQEEAPFLGKPVLVMRRVTERPEAVEAGAVRVVGEQPAAIVTACSQLLTDPAVYNAMACPMSPYGDGHAAERVAEVLRTAEA